MRRNIFPLILLFSLILPGSLAAKEKPELPPKYKKWLDEKEALRAWEKSLEINPKQPKIEKKIEEIKKN